MLPSRLLDGHVAGVDGLHLRDREPRVRDLLGQLAVGALGGVEQGAGLLHLSVESSSLPLGDSNLLAHLLPGSGFVLKALNSVPQLLLVPLQSLQTLSVGLVGLVESNLQFINVSFKLLLDSQCLGFRFLLCLKGNIERLHCTGMIFASIVELILLLSNSAVDVGPDLLQLHRGSQNLVLLLLQSALCFLQSRLQLFLLLLKTTPLLVKIMDGATSISKLVKKILDLISEVLVL